MRIHMLIRYRFVLRPSRQVQQRNNAMDPDQDIVVLEAQTKACQ